MGRRADDRGAAAVEFALVTPVLIMLVLGIAEFARAYNVQTTLTQAAREGVRAMAIYNDVMLARSTTKTAASPTLALSDAQITVSPLICPVATGTAPAPSVTVTVNYQLPFLTSFFGSGISLTGKGVMKCNG